MSDTRRKDKHDSHKKRFKNHVPRYRKDQQKPNKARVDRTDLISGPRLNRAELKRVAEDTIQRSQQLKLRLEPSITFLKEQLDALLSKQSKQLNPRFDTDFEVELETTLAGIYRLLEENEAQDQDHETFKLGVLNFASAKNPGGGFQNGSMAQEESLAYASALYETIKDSAVYDLNSKDNKLGFYHDSVIFSPDVALFRDSDLDPLDEDESSDSSNDASTASSGSHPRVNFLTVPAVNVGLCERHQIGKREMKDVLLQRMDYFLAVAVKYGITHLVLGSWGCGVFGNQIDTVAQGFITLLTTKYDGQFEEVCFSVMQKSHATIFTKALDQAFN